MMGHLMHSVKTCNSVRFYSMKNSISDISRKWILPNMIRVRMIALHFFISLLLYIALHYVPIHKSSESN